ncbi:hypothetical protein Tco_1023512, partial [Tanacetum coccineum]
LVASPTGLCSLVPYSDSDSDSPDEISSSEHISPLPAISPFLCTNSSEALDSSDGPPSQDPYVMTVARWRSKVASRPLICMDIANIIRKRSKPDKHGHGKGKENTRAGRMLSKDVDLLQYLDVRLDDAYLMLTMKYL